MTNLESEANDLLVGASRAISTNKSLAELQTMDTVHEALDKLIHMHCHNPYTIAMCCFLLGAYVAFEYHNVEKFLKEG